jgi:beta-lactam-binding protein with PASTA domain
MAKKEYSKSSINWRMVLINVTAAVALIAILVGVLVFGLRKYTQHGVEITVPKITTMHIAEANILAEAEGLRVEVIDSTYSTKVPLGTIVEQSPTPGSKVKSGRTIYVIQNARFRRPVIIPELRDISYRQAEATIKSLGLGIAEIVYEPSTYKNIILDVRLNDSSLVAGARLEEGTQVTLVVGKGKGEKQVTVPHLAGKSMEEARSWLLAHSLTLGSLEYDIEPDEETQGQYIIYQQTPQSGTVVVEGTSVNIKLTTDIEKALITGGEENDEEDFF